MQKLLRVQTHTEFGRLRRVLVGRLNHDWFLPHKGVDLGWDGDYNKTTAESIPNLGIKFPKTMLDKASADLDSFANVMTREGIQVDRVKQVDERTLCDLRTTHWTCAQAMGAYSTRDLILTVGNRLIICPCLNRSRRFEIEEYYSEWLAGFTPETITDMRPMSPLRDTDYVSDETPIFDAASILKVKEGVLAYLVVDGLSNECGLRALRTLLPEYEIIALRGFRNEVHVDTTIAILDSTTILYNKDWVTETQVADAFDAFGFRRYLPCPEVVDSQWTMNGICSKYIGLNFLSLDKDLVAVISNQRPLIEMLQDCGFRVIPLSMPFARDFIGGPHCVTLDIDRDN